ncbi:hypothetical protein QTP70_010408 [Hemibagrus guttatus]|uniref:Alkylated DNA repair protein AlkB homologue 8 N-terminal domain-containing protein n=1 Tax=Hemibagrus guttatus TaxID=175788 RepID=A0AAE0Q605_9TELE|nr:hypothetical protein QTP70_010408 [Hemibagrus guttatus]
MKSGKAVGPDDILVEVWKCLGEAAVEFLTSLFNRVLEMMDQLSEEVRQESPWTMMFADDIVICSESREQVEESLERWRFALERRGMKVSHIQSNGECEKEERRSECRQVGMGGERCREFCVIGKYQRESRGRTVVRPAMLYDLETVSLRKRQESELEVAELKMLRFSLGVTRLDRIRNEYIRGTAHVGRLGDKAREARWFGHVQRRESEYIGRRMLDMELPGRMQRTAKDEGCVLSPLLYSLYTYDCVATSNSTTIIKFADNTVVVGLISANNETVYLEEIRNLENWWRNNLLLNISKTKELIVNFRMKQERNYQTPVINESPVERVDGFRYLGVHITQDLSWSCHINTVVKKAWQCLYHLRRLRYFRLPSKVLRNLLLHHREYSDRKHSNLVREQHHPYQAS